MEIYFVLFFLSRVSHLRIPWLILTRWKRVEKTTYEEASILLLLQSHDLQVFQVEKLLGKPEEGSSLTGMIPAKDVS